MSEVNVYYYIDINENGSTRMISSVRYSELKSFFVGIISDILKKHPDVNKKKIAPDDIKYLINKEFKAKLKNGNSAIEAALQSIPVKKRQAVINALAEYVFINIKCGYYKEPYFIVEDYFMDDLLMLINKKSPKAIDIIFSGNGKAKKKIQELKSRAFDKEHSWPVFEEKLQGKPAVKLSISGRIKRLKSFKKPPLIIKLHH